MILSATRINKMAFTRSFSSTPLRVAPTKRDTFGMPDPNLKDLDQTGPLSELLA
jgi:hypothetical protein